MGFRSSSVHSPDKNPTHRFHHYMKRNDEELRVEVSGYHQRQPYAVLVAVVFLPVEACATLMLEGGADIRYIQEMLGQAKLDTTQLYTRVSIEQLKTIHSATHPARLERSETIAEELADTHPEQDPNLEPVDSASGGSHGDP